MNSMIFLNTYEFFLNLIILQNNVESYYENISKIRKFWTNPNGKKRLKTIRQITI